MTPQQIGRAAYWQGAPLKACPFPKQHMASHIAWGGGWMAEHDADGGVHAMQHGMARDLQAAGHSKDEAFEMVGLPAQNQQGTRGQLTKQRGSCKVVVYHNQRQCSTDTAARKREDNQQ